MNTPIDHENDDDRPESVRQAEIGATGWRAVMRAQHGATPDHADFYNLAANLYDTLDALATLARVLVWQVRGYADGLPEGSAAYDDSRGTPGAVDPAVRLGRAEAELEQLALAADIAVRRAMDFWSTIGHIGVEDVTS